MTKKNIVYYRPWRLYLLNERLFDLFMELIFNLPKPIDVPLTIGSWEGLSVPLDFAITYTHSFRSHMIDKNHRSNNDNHDRNFYIHSYKVFIRGATICRSATECGNILPIFSFLTLDYTVQPDSVEIWKNNYLK